MEKLQTEEGEEFLCEYLNDKFLLEDFLDHAYDRFLDCFIQAAVDNFHEEAEKKYDLDKGN